MLIVLLHILPNTLVEYHTKPSHSCTSYPVNITSICLNFSLYMCMAVALVCFRLNFGNLSTTDNSYISFFPVCVLFVLIHFSAFNHLHNNHNQRQNPTYFFQFHLRKYKKCTWNLNCTVMSHFNIKQVIFTQLLLKPI